MALTYSVQGRNCLSYQGQQLDVFDQSSFGFLSGNGLCLLTTDGKHKDFEWSPFKRGISATAVSWPTAEFALAMVSSPTVVKVFSHPSRGERLSLKTDLRGRFISMDFSRDGKRLAALGDYTDHRLFVWSLEEGTLLCAENVPVTCDACSFNPTSNGDTLVLCGTNGVVVASVMELLDQRSLRFTPVPLTGSTARATAADDSSQASAVRGGEIDEDGSQADTETASNTSVMGSAAAAEAQSHVHAHTWLLGNRVMCATGDRKLHTVDVNTMTVVARQSAAVRAGCRVSSLLLTKTHVIAASTDGTLTWYAHEANMAIEQRVLAVELAADSERRKSLSITAAAGTPDFSTIIFGTAEGSIYKCPMSVQLMQNAEEVQQVTNVVRGEAVVTDIPVFFGRLVRQLRGAGMLCGARVLVIKSDVGGGDSQPQQAVPATSVFATGGINGSVTLWTMGVTSSAAATAAAAAAAAAGGIHQKVVPELQVIKEWNISTMDESGNMQPEDITAMDAAKHVPTLAVGTTHGTLDLYYIEHDPHRVPLPPHLYETLLFRHRYFTSAVSCTSFSSTGSYLAVASFAASKAVILDVSAHQLFVGLATIHCKKEWGGILSMCWDRSMTAAGSLEGSDEVLLCSTANGWLVAFNPPQAGEVQINATQPLEPAWAHRSGVAPLTSLVSLTGSGIVGGTCPSREEMFIFPAPQDMPVVAKSTEDVVQPCAVLAGALSPLLSCTTTDDASVLLGTAIDGSLICWTVDGVALASDEAEIASAFHTPRAPSSHGRTHLHVTPILAVITAPLCNGVLTASADGSVMYSDIVSTSMGEVRHVEVHQPTLVVTPSNDLGFAAVEARERANEVRNSDANSVATAEAPVDEDILSTEEGRIRLRSQRDAQRLVHPVRLADKTWPEEEQEYIQAALRQENIAMRNKLLADMTRVRGALQAALTHNDEVPELEKLERSEFVIDVAGAEDLKRQNQLNTLAKKEEIARQDTRADVVSARIIKACWNSMEEQACRVVALQREGVEVSNFQVSAATADELKQLERMKRMRALEMREILWCDNNGMSARERAKINGVSWAAARREINNDSWWLLNEGQAWPGTDIVERIVARDKRRIEARGKSKGKKADGEDEDEEDDMAGNEEIKAGDSVDEEEDEDEEFGMDTSAAALASKMINMKDITTLMYPPTALRSPMQKRMQMVFLQEFVREIKRSFNKRFKDLAAEKEQEVERIETKNERIREILEELHSNETYFTPEMDPRENPQSLLEIDDSELVNKPYETEEMRQKRLREEEERRRREAEQNKDNIGERGLYDMMYGTLEVKKDVLAEVAELDRPSFMDEVPEEAWTDEQKKEAAEFEEEQRVLLEEQAKIRKALDQELKRLRNDVSEICREFDSKIEEMTEMRQRVQIEIVAQEMYITRLSVSLSEREDAKIVLRNLERQIADVRGKRGELSSTITGFEGHVADMRDKLQALQDEERMMEKTFKRDMQAVASSPLDQDTIEALVKLYKLRIREDVSTYSAGSRSQSAMRTSQRKSRRTSFNRRSFKKKSLRSSGRVSGSAQNSGMGPLQEALKEAQARETRSKHVSESDPFRQVDLAKEKADELRAAAIPRVVLLDEERDFPDLDVEEAVRSELQKLRANRIRKEAEVQQASIAYSEVRQQLDVLKKEEASLSVELDGLRDRHKEVLEQLDREDRDLSIMVNIQQGQDEVDRGAVVTDYAEACLVPTTVINALNERIAELGDEKVHVLDRIRLFRKRINLIQWETEHLQLEKHNFEEHFTDLQLLRVTRELQELLGGAVDEGQRKSKEGQAARRLKTTGETYAARVAKLEKVVKKLKLQIRDQERENGQLGEQLQELQESVAVRESIQRSRVESASATSLEGTGGDATAQARARMKRLMMRRKLVELAKAQTQEIDYLRQELDRLRQRTFPSFVQATRTRLTTNPDEL